MHFTCFLERTSAIFRCHCIEELVRNRFFNTASRFSAVKLNKSSHCCVESHGHSHKKTFSSWSFSITLAASKFELIIYTHNDQCNHPCARQEFHQAFKITKSTTLICLFASRRHCGHADTSDFQKYLLNARAFIRHLKELSLFKPQKSASLNT